MKHIISIFGLLLIAVSLQAFNLDSLNRKRKEDKFASSFPNYRDAFPGHTIHLVDTIDQYLINNNLEFFSDTNQNLTIQNVSKASRDKFLLKNPYTEYFNKYYWIKFTVANRRTSENQSWYFESWNFDIDDIEFYVPNKKGGYIRTSMGYEKNFYQRNIRHKNLQFLISLQQSEVATYYVRVKIRYHTGLIFLVRTHERFIEHALTEYWYLGIFYGIFAFIIFINIFLFFRLREKIYLLYILLACSEVLFCFGRDGLGFQFLWPEHPWINYLTHYTVTQFLLVVFTLLFGIEFLKLKKKWPLMYRISLIAMSVKIMVFSFSFIEGPISRSYTFIIDSVIIFIPFLSGIVLLKRGNKYVKYYVVAFSCLYTGFLLILLEERSILPFSIFNWYLINAGMLLEAIFLAISLLDQIRILRRENQIAQQNIINQLQENEKLKDKVNLELEEKVKERTDKINQMLTSLELKNDQLLSANQELEVLSERVREMNQLLNRDNEKLKVDITQINKSRVLLKNVTFEEFQKVFPDENACLKYLSELKWSKGFKCKKCGYSKASNSKTFGGMRCKGCNYDESPTTDTLFHGLKFPITKAFYLIHLITSRKKITLNQLSEIVSLRKETCWSFRKKILQAMENKDEKGWDSFIMNSLNE